MQHVANIDYMISNTITTPLTIINLLVMLVCPEGAVRLVNRSYTSSNGLATVSGVVQVCVNQRYGYVCADDWYESTTDT